MFYSQSFLARKGPLGTVWCAAHLQHRLRKTHYVTTNVLTTVEKIMNPEVPIALRMSGHLLLGVVRIYSKQVDYFFEDCNEIWITVNRVFTTVTVNLPSDGAQAPFHSVTLPENFNLDAMELDDCNMNWCEDSHLKRLDEITLTEQIPTGKDPYIVIRFDEHDLRASSSMEVVSGSGPVQMEEDDPHVELDASATGFKSPSTNNNSGGDGNGIPQDMPSAEIMRKAQDGFNFNSSLILSDRAEPDKFLEDQINRDKMHTPVREEAVFPEAHFSSSHNHEEQHTPGRLDSEMPFAHHSPMLEIQPTPTLEIQPSPCVSEPKVKRKKRQSFDPEIVLTMEYIKNTLADTSDIVRVRGNWPLTSLSIWKRNKKRRLEKEGFIAEPSVTGCSADLLDIYREDCTTNHPVDILETHKEINVVDPFLSTHGSNIEIEVPRNKDHSSPEGFMDSLSTPVPSLSGRSHFAPENSNLRLGYDDMEMTDGYRTLPTSDVGESWDFDSETRTRDAFYGSDIQFDNTVFSDIPELAPSGGDLQFLEQDDNSPPAGSQGTPLTGMFPGNQNTPELQALSSRTRAVAQYLKNQSVTPISGNSEKPSENLCLEKILEDKPRKISARMFYETLVLTNCGLVDVRQEEPYGDIILKVTPKLSKERFSGC